MRSLCFGFLCAFSCLSAGVLNENSRFFQEKLNQEEQIIQRILANCKDIGLSFSEVKQIVYFIENHLSEFVFQSDYYIDKNISGLPCDIEYDPSTDLLFIHLNCAVPGKSKKKALKKAIQYDVENSKIVVVITSKESEALKAEIIIINQLQHIDGVIRLLSAQEHVKEDLNIQEMIIPFYEKRDLKSLTRRDFSLREKISFAVDLMQILQEIHAEGIIHDDIHMGNLILEKNKKNNKNIRYSLVLIDFEKARAVGGCSYLMHRDLYFAGCTLYCLLNSKTHYHSLYGKVDQLRSFFENPKSICSDKSILGEVSKEVSQEMKKLSKKKSKDMTLEEKFKLAVLQMLHPTCNGTTDAAYWCEKYKRLLEEK